MGKIIPGLIPIPEDIKKRQRTLSRAHLNDGWYDGFEYRANTYDSNFEPHGNYCDVCKCFHKIPYQDEIGYITEGKPLDVAKKWSNHHHIESVIERRPVKYHHKEGKKTFALNTYIDQVIACGEWISYKKVTKLGEVFTIF